MQSLVSAADKQVFQDAFANIHPTFARPIAIYKTAQQVVVNTNPSNNVYFPDAPFNDTVENIVVSGMFDARVKWNPKQDFRLFSDSYGAGDIQSTLKMLEGVVRIKLDATGAAYMAGSTRYVVDGKECEKLTTEQPHGLFSPDFYTFYLKRLN